MSWGPMQIMGSVAREIGYADHLTKLLDPAIGILWGSKKLAKLSRIYKSQDDVIASYNAGSPVKTMKGELMNQAYVDGVRQFMVDLSKKP